MPTGRWCLSTSVVGERIYAIGGITDTSTLFLTVEEYDPATDTWTKKVDMPTERGALASVVDGKIYVIGGTTTGWPNRGSKTVEEYNSNPLVVDFIDCIYNLLRHMLKVYANFGQNLLCCNSFVSHDLPFKKITKTAKSFGDVRYYKTYSYIAPVKNITHKLKNRLFFC